MKIHFKLGWVRAGKAAAKSFKAPAAHDLFSDYCRRISRFEACEVSGFESSKITNETRAKFWICDRGVGSKALSSEDLAVALGKSRDSGTRELQILIGGPDGFTRSDRMILKPDLIWSLGPMTLPHELASVVASEQIYRALTILSRLPYHLGH